MDKITSEINYDYINQKILYLPLIKGCSVVIRPFEYSEKLDGLFELLREFYVIEEIDMNNINDPAHLDGFFCSYDDTEKKSLLLLKNVTQGTMDEVVKYPEILFIALEKDLGIDYSGFKRIAVFNKKTKRFSTLFPKSLISANSLAYKWIKDKIIADLKSKGMLEVKDYLSRIYEKAVSLFELLPAISKSLYGYFCNDLSSQEQKVVCAVCEHYYNVKLPDYTKKNIAQKKSKEVEEVEEVEEVNEVKEIEKIEEVEKVEEPEIIQPAPQIIEKKAIDENQINQEIWNLISNGNGSPGYNALSLSLADIKPSTKEIFTTPEKKYFYLRSNQWKTQIPYEFFKNLYLFFVREEIKSDNVLKPDFNFYLRDKHNYMVDICSMIVSPEFKQMDPTEFAGDEILRSYLKKEPMVSHVLPVQSQKKNVSPKEIGKMFSQDISSVNKDKREDFDTQYRKNLERLKEEFGEREINAELVGKLRNRTKELQSKISALFQD